MSLKVSKGGSPIEQQALDARLERLGVALDAKTRTVNEGGAGGSKVKGGLRGLEKAASATGPANVLDMGDASAIRENVGLGDVGQWIARIRGKDGRSVARASLKGATMSLDAAGKSIESLVKDVGNSGYLEFGALDGTLRRINKAATDLEGATSKSALAYADKADLDALREAYAGCLGSIRKYGGLMDKIVNDGYRPKVRELATHHNAQGIWGRLTSGLPVELITSIEQQISVLNTNVRRMTSMESVFQPHAPELDKGLRLAEDLVASMPATVPVSTPFGTKSMGYEMSKIAAETELPLETVRDGFQIVLDTYAHGRRSASLGNKVIPQEAALLKQVDQVMKSMGQTGAEILPTTAQLLVGYAAEKHQNDPAAFLAALKTVEGSRLPPEHPHSSA